MQQKNVGISDAHKKVSLFVARQMSVKLDTLPPEACNFAAHTQRRETRSAD
jgi:hypothetical protein